jgi:hypothetical protein
MVWNRISNWKVKFLSQAGKEILLKAVVLAIPTYCIGVFQLTISLCKEINSLMQKFWLGHMANTSKIHWLSWDKMGLAKSAVGLSFRDLVLFNKALLAKQGWRIIKEPNSIDVLILKAKYFPHSGFMEADLGTRPSYAWCSIFNSRELLEQGLWWRVGDRREINIWGDRWLPTPSTFSVQSTPRCIPVTSKVMELIDLVSKSWKADMISAMFSTDEAKVILGIPLSPSLPRDCLIWRGTTTGMFTVYSAYHLAKELQDNKGGQCSYQEKGKEVWKCLWSLEVPQVVKTFMWRSFNNALPTKPSLLS